MDIKCIALDVANTILHKPVVLQIVHEILKENKFDIPIHSIKQHHKLVSELIQFPDVTSREFYNEFNASFLLSLGVIPTDTLLTAIFSRCTYKDWEPFEDTQVLETLDIPLVIFSNFNKNLPQLLKKQFEVSFKHVVASEDLGVAKPSLQFYEMAIDHVGVPAENILYVGDSLKLDIIPAKKLGMQTLLIDRDEIYPAYPERIVTLKSLTNYI